MQAGAPPSSSPVTPRSDQRVEGIPRRPIPRCDSIIGSRCWRSWGIERATRPGQLRRNRSSPHHVCRIRRPWNVLQYLPRDAWQFGDVRRDQEFSAEPALRRVFASLDRRPPRTPRQRQQRSPIADLRPCFSPFISLSAEARACDRSSPACRAVIAAPGQARAGHPRANSCARRRSGAADGTREYWLGHGRNGQRP